MFNKVLAEYVQHTQENYDDLKILLPILNVLERFIDNYIYKVGLWHSKLAPVFNSLKFEQRKNLNDLMVTSIDSVLSFQETLGEFVRIISAEKKLLASLLESVAGMNLLKSYVGINGVDQQVEQKHAAYLPSHPVEISYGDFLKNGFREFIETIAQMKKSLLELNREDAQLIEAMAELDRFLEVIDKVIAKRRSFFI